MENKKDIQIVLTNLEEDIHKLYNSKCYLNPNNVFKDIINLIEFYKINNNER